MFRFRHKSSLVDKTPSVYVNSFFFLPVSVFCPVEDLGSLFEKRNFKDRPQTTGTKSTLSLRLEQCPQQLNNPFNEYSKFDGKVNYSTFYLGLFGH